MTNLEYNSFYNKFFRLHSKGSTKKGVEKLFFERPHNFGKKTPPILTMQSFLESSPPANSA